MMAADAVGGAGAQVLREKVKKYKHRNQGLDEELAKQMNKVLVLEDANALLKKQLQVCMLGVHAALLRVESRGRATMRCRS
jgi:hypothetical protein